ncbi:MAG TPA: sensor histidine kinase N-terminal domain-containing protein [Steroidobacteraceae bacterium]|nr:sensor histidine kinase N-terminal domain-containing protein [Steroidobacteraceae bacterium]
MPERSLRSGLTLRVLAVALLLLVLDGIYCYALSAHFANLAYDRWLIDDAGSLAQALSVENGRASVVLPRVALAIFKFDDYDQTYYRVSTAQGRVLANDGALPDVAPGRGGKPLLTSMTIDGMPMRIVATEVRLPGSTDIVHLVVGETVNKRATLLSEILLEMALPQLGLLLGALLFVRFAVDRGLRPLTLLSAAIEARGHDLLTPVSEEGLPWEARILVSRINDLLGRLDQTITAQRRFVADAAHQLRTPLAAVSLHAERAQRSSDAESRDQALRSLQTSIVRAARVTQQLLALARSGPEAAVTRTLSRLDLTALARTAGENWIGPALARSIDFGFVAPEHPVYIQGHAGLLEELLNNLIDNALRYCPQGASVTVTVSGSAFPELSVTDDGPGVAESERERIFERFHRGATEDAEGCGLGLAIVREIATVHGATVKARPGRDGRGTSFVVKFPRAA